MDLDPKSGTRRKESDRYVLCVHDGARMFLCKAAQGKLWILPCTRLFPVPTFTDKTRMRSFREVLCDVTYGTAILWLDECMPDWPTLIKVHTKVFGVEGTLLELQLASKLLDRLIQATDMSAKYLSHFAKDTFTVRMHKVQAVAFDQAHKVCPEAFHCIQYLTSRPS